ncbi:MAG TPA: hypothetical protein VFE07_03910 [Marmoricola sp.]|nr:hypothetical protein [Marmoricola sp.]
MSTHVATTNPARSDLRFAEDHPTAPATRSTSRLWALSGLGAGVLGLATIVTSSMVDVVYRDEFKGTTDGVAKALEDKTGVLFAFHSITTIGAILMVVFAAGLFRRLRRGAGDSIAPTVAFAGLIGTAVVSVLGAGLDTEIMMALATGDENTVPDSTAALYNNWVGTIPWVWVLAGLAGVAVYATSRLSVVPRWIGRVGLVMGGLAMVLGISPLEYMAGPVAALWLVVTSVGFLVGDKAHRSANA